MKEKENLLELGRYLYHLRKQKDVSLSAVGKAIGKSHNFLSEVENGKKLPSDETLRSIASYFNVNEDTLYGMLGRVPLRATEYVKDNPDLQRVLSEIQASRKISCEKKREITDKIVDLYSELLEENNED